MFSFYQINSFQIMTKIFSFQLKFFLHERIFGDIFLHNYLDFLETNPIVQYLLPLFLQTANLSSEVHFHSKIIFISVCNFLVHEKCLKSTTNPCVSVAATIVKVRLPSSVKYKPLQLGRLDRRTLVELVKLV